MQLQCRWFIYLFF